MVPLSAGIQRGKHPTPGEIGNPGAFHRAGVAGESRKTLKGGSDILSDFGYSEVLADRPGKEVSNLIVSWNRRSLIQFRILPP
jgi:hypothetical protein